MVLYLDWAGLPKLDTRVDQHTWTLHAGGAVEFLLDTWVLSLSIHGRLEHIHPIVGLELPGE